MFIITGPGRSGTSFLATLFNALGFTLEGSWSDVIKAGLEDPEVTLVNSQILDHLGIAPFGRERRIGRQPVLGMIGRALLSDEKRYHLRRRMATSLVQQVATTGEFPWKRLDELAGIFQGRMSAVAMSRAVVKDPQFTWTLPVWRAADIDIDFVVATSRDLAFMLASRKQARHMTVDDDAGRNSMIYGLGLLRTTLEDGALPHCWLRFPDFLDDPNSLYDALCFPEPVNRADFLAAFAEVVKMDWVHQTPSLP